MDQNELKALVGQAAVKFIEDGMIVGLGTGSTVRYMVDALGKRVQEEGLNVIGVTTSNRTTAQAQSLGITIKDIDEVDHIDLCIDGADEIDTDFNGIKGGRRRPALGKDRQQRFDQADLDRRRIQAGQADRELRRAGRSHSVWGPTRL